MHDDRFGWRDRAIALAALGSAGLSRSVFAHVDEIDLAPVEMQVLLALALRESLTADPPSRTGTHWLSVALTLERPAIEKTVHRLESVGLVRRSSSTEDAGEIRYELGGDDDEEAVIAKELPIAVTELGFATVDSWLKRTRPRLAGWPTTRADVDDAID